MTGLPSLLAALGLVGILFGVLNLLVGLFSTGVDPPWVRWNLFVGLVLLVVAAYINFDGLRERLKSGEARRAGKYGTSAILTAVLTIAILALSGFLATRYHTRFDWSEQKVHSLTSQSVKVLESLDRDVEVLALYPAIEAGPVRDLLDRYAYVSDRFHLTVADPNEQPGLLEKCGIAPEDLGRGLVCVRFGDESVEVKEVNEESITNAMVKLSRTGEKRVYFLEGHNERPIGEEAAKEKHGFSRAADALRNENYQVESLLLASKGEVPDDADVVIVAGATRPLLQSEHTALERYLERGGAVMVLVDPRAKTDLVDDIAQWGIDLGDDVVVDRQRALFGRATTPFAGRYDTTHEITREMRETTLFHVVRSVRKGDPGDANLTEIVFTGDDSWAERDLERFYGEGQAELGDEDLPGPVPVAVAGTWSSRSATGQEAEDDEDGDGDELPDNASAEARIVVFGDSDFASNELIESYRNRDLFVNSVNWLLGDVEAIAIRPNRSRASSFQLSSGQFMRIRSLSLFVLPQAIGVLGVIVWWTRRRAPGR